MKHSTPRPTKADLQRFDALYALGCIACFLRTLGFRYPEIHHLNLDGKAGQKRRGHQYTIPLCGWHHVGKVDFGRSSLGMAEKYGPSLAKQSKRFREIFGTDDVLLERVNKMLAERKVA